MPKLRYMLPALFLVCSQVQANDYPTVEIVRYVVNCMADNGEQTEETLYACTCRFDALSSKFSFEEFEQISVYNRNKPMPGEKGAVFRDLGKSTKALRDRYAEAEKNAVSACPVARRVARTVKSK